MFILLIAFCHIIYYESRKESCRYGLFLCKMTGNRYCGIAMFILILPNKLNFLSKYSLWIQSG